MDMNLIVVVITSDKFGKRQVAGAWRTDKPDPDRAIAVAAKEHGTPVEDYKKTFSPEVWEFRPDALSELP
jgi:hypothetical protein